MCGEKLGTAGMVRQSGGSPPHVRGKVKKTQKSVQETRITPACAGKSQSDHRHASAEGDHPRMCGEKFTRKSAINCGSGSPPHVRGKAYEKEGRR